MTWARVDELKRQGEELRERVEAFTGWKLLESDGVFFIAQRTTDYPWLPPWRKTLVFRSRSASDLLETIEEANRCDGLLPREVKL